MKDNSLFHTLSGMAQLIGWNFALAGIWMFGATGIGWRNMVSLLSILTFAGILYLLFRRPHPPAESPAEIGSEWMLRLPWCLFLTLGCAGFLWWNVWLNFPVVALSPGYLAALASVAVLGTAGAELGWCRKPLTETVRRRLTVWNALIVWAVAAELIAGAGAYRIAQFAGSEYERELPGAAWTRFFRCDEFAGTPEGLTEGRLYGHSGFAEAQSWTGNFSEEDFRRWVREHGWNPVEKSSHERIPDVLASAFPNLRAPAKFQLLDGVEFAGRSGWAFLYDGAAHRLYGAWRSR